MTIEATQTARARTTVIALLAALALVACGQNDDAAQQSAAANGSDDRELVIGMTQYPSTMNPNVDSMVAKSYVRAMLMRAVTRFNHAWELECNLCVELPTLENGLIEVGVDLVEIAKGDPFEILNRLDQSPIDPRLLERRMGKQNQ